MENQFSDTKSLFESSKAELTDLKQWYHDEKQKVDHLNDIKQLQ
jgi:hypothetical protein